MSEVLSQRPHGRAEWQSKCHGADAGLSGGLRRDDRVKASASGHRGPLADTVGYALGMADAAFTMKPIGFVRSPFNDTRAIPKGLGARHDEEGVLEIDAALEPGLLDVEGFSHLFVIWVFDRSDGVELRGTPPSDDKPHGVFATRSPYRPNPIGLTVVELLRRDANRLHVRGVDMLDGTPILDLKPYLSGIPEEKLRRGWLAEAEKRKRS